MGLGELSEDVLNFIPALTTAVEEVHAAVVAHDGQPFFHRVHSLQKEGVRLPKRISLSDDSFIPAEYKGVLCAISSQN